MKGRSRLVFFGLGIGGFCLVPVHSGCRLAAPEPEAKPAPAPQKDASPGKQPGAPGAQASPEPSASPVAGQKTEAAAAKPAKAAEPARDPVTAVVETWASQHTLLWERKVQPSKGGERREWMWVVGAEKSPKDCAEALEKTLRASFSQVQTLPSGSKERFSFRATDDNWMLIGVCGKTHDQKNAAHFEVRRRSSRQP